MKIASILAILATTLPTAALAADLTDAQKVKIDKIVTEELAKSRAPSASIAVVADGKLAYLKAYGDADISPRVPANSTVRYPIGSISKQFTATAVLMLVEEGKLSLDEPIARWYPGVTSSDKITLRHLLSHTSGIADYWPQDYVIAPITRDTNPDKVIAEWGAKPLAFQPGERFEYSNTGFMIAGRIVEKVSGKSLEAFLRQRVWTPLGMTSVTNFDARGMKPPKDAVGYSRAALGPPRVALHEGSGWGLGAFQWAMTAEDLAKWDQSLLNRTLLKPASYDQFFADNRLNNGQFAGYGLGLQIRQPATVFGATTYRSRASLIHTGEVSGYVSANIVYPNERAAIAVLTNTDTGSPVGAILAGIAGIVDPPEFLSDAPRPPAIAARASQPLPPVVATVDTRVTALFASLRRGEIDRSGMTRNLSEYFSPSVLKDFADSLSPLGEPKSITGAGWNTRGGMNIRRYTVTYPDRTLIISVYVSPDGDFEQFLVSQG